jgi:hypothetical protein
LDITDGKQNQGTAIGLHKSWTSLGVLVSGVAHNFNNLMGDHHRGKPTRSFGAWPADVTRVLKNVERINRDLAIFGAANIVSFLTAYASAGIAVRADDAQCFVEP